MTDIEQIIEKVVRKLELTDYLTLEEIAKKAKVQPITIKRWCIAGDLPYTLLGKNFRIKPRDWIKFCEDRAC